MLVGFLAAASFVSIIRTDLEVAAAVAEDRNFVPSSKPHVENLFPSSLKSTELNIVKEAAEVNKASSNAPFLGMAAQRPMPQYKRLWQKQRLRRKWPWQGQTV